jgi:hypothetical protein
MAGGESPPKKRPPHINDFDKKIFSTVQEMKESYGMYEPDRFFELLELMQRVSEGSMSCRFAARKFLTENDKD